MVAIKRTAPLIVIVGETATGKTALAIRLAKLFNGEIISADSRTVFKGMDIGTAKPTPYEQAQIPHHLLDLVKPDQNFSAADFKKLALETIDNIGGRGKLPIMVGGSGLYVNSVIYDYKFRFPAKTAAREVLNQKSVAELQLMILERQLPMPNNSKNPRHLIRTIETDGAKADNIEIRPHTLIVGLQSNREDLKNRVEKRVDEMLNNGLESEVRQLARQYGWDNQALHSVGYWEWQDYFLGRDDIARVRQKIIKATLDLAKRQRTWFKRNKSIHWLSTPVKWQLVVDATTTFLNPNPRTLN